MFESFKKDKPETGGRPSVGRRNSGRTAQSNISRSSQQRMPRNITGRRGDGKSPVHRGEGKNTVDDTVKSGQGQFIDPRQMRTRNTVEELAAAAGSGRQKTSVRPKLIDFTRKHKEKEKNSRKKAIRNIAIVIAVVAAVSGIIAALLFSPVLALQSGFITVTGTNEWVQPQEIRKIAQKQSGRSLFLLDTKAINDQAAKIPGVSGAKVSRRFPHGIEVRVLASKPAAVLKTDSGQTQAVDSRGRTMSAEKASVDGIPVITVADFTAALKQNAVKQALKVLSALPEDLRSQITSVTAETQDSVTTVLKSGYTIIWGNSSQMDFKKAIVRKTLEKLAEDKSPNRVIDVSAPDHAVIKPDNSGSAGSPSAQ